MFVHEVWMWVWVVSIGGAGQTQIVLPGLSG